ncbi:hypothetical protein HK102_003589 [Quaeritorhiza haematococci]|nr:hypothetical protein HK102_003589 [Quaeritorhiza haematococci]
MRKRVFDAIDFDKDGIIDFQDYVVTLSAMSSQGSTQQKVELFKKDPESGISRGALTEVVRAVLDAATRRSIYSYMRRPDASVPQTASTGTTTRVGSMHSRATSVSTTESRGHNNPLHAEPLGDAELDSIVEKMVHATFAEADLDGDGLVSLSEFQKHLTRHPALFGCTNVDEFLDYIYQQHDGTSSACKIF